MATAQPIKPNIPRPNQTSCTPRRFALSFRVSSAPILRLKAVSRLSDAFSEFSPMMKHRKATNDSALQLRHRRPHAFLLIVQRQKLPLDGLAKLSEIGTPDGLPDGDQHLSAHLHQNTLVHRDVNLPGCFGGISQNAWRQGRHAVEPMR